MRTARGPALASRLEALVASEPGLRRAAELARTHGCRILLVGGAVRDLALGRSLQDLDFILEGRPAGFLRALSRMVGHRVVTFRKKGIVDHRIRVGIRVGIRDGTREWDFVERGRRSLRQEILRRDFTINAVAYDPIARTLLDPADGLADLRRRRIRAVSSGVFAADPLRMLRAVRLRAEIVDLSLEKDTASLIRSHAARLRRVSPERIKSEMDRMLASARPSGAVRQLEHLGLLREILPELDPLRGLAQNRYHHLDAFRHTLAALEAADELRVLARGLPRSVFSADPLESAPGEPLRSRAIWLRWALLLHDTGKAETRTRGEDGEYHFYLHERESSRIAQAVLKRLRASRAETLAIERVVALHLRLSIPPSGEMTRRAFRRIVREAGDLTPLLVLHTLADKIASHGPGHARTLARLRRAGRGLLETWKEEAERARAAPPLLSGNDVMDALGIGPGPRVGALLEELWELQAAGDLTDREQALAWVSAKRDPEPSPLS